MRLAENLTPDDIREGEMARLAMIALYGKTRKERVRANNEYKKLHAQRSPEFIEKMEREKGLS